MTKTPHDKNSLKLDSRRYANHDGEFCFLRSVYSLVMNKQIQTRLIN